MLIAVCRRGGRDLNATPPVGAIGGQISLLLAGRAGPLPAARKLNLPFPRWRGVFLIILSVVV